MLMKIFQVLGWTNGQISRFDSLVNVISSLTPESIDLKKIIAGILVVIELFSSAAFKTSVHPFGQEVDLSEYNLVFSDEFDGSELNTDVWYTRGNGPRRCGYNAASQVKVENGNLVITGEYLTDGEYGEGWYAAAVALKQKYTKGYFEIRCICNDCNDYWSAFWLQGNHPYDHELSAGGVGSAEIDIFEAMDHDALLPTKKNSVSHTVWCNGFDDDVENLDKCSFSSIGNNIYKEFNTYGLEWTDDEYIFYVNGVETGRTSFGNGVSTDLEEVIASLEIPDGGINMDTSLKTEFIVDYVKVWQK